MAHIVWTPWREHKELLAVRSQLYPLKDGTGPDMRRNACGVISSWRLRGNLPHAVESTWFLTEAVLTDDISVNKIATFAVRACYATAFCRFVTGLVDSEQGARKSSMYIKATQVGIPASFVELRHEATHGELPSLVVLRRAADRALEWLWNDYWKHLQIWTGNLDIDNLSAFKDGHEKLRETLREVLCSYVLGYTHKLWDRSHLDILQDKNEAEEACLKIVRICGGEKLAITELARVLLEHKMLVPELKTLGGHMDNTFSMWDSLLKKLTAHQEQFLIILVDEMAIQISSPSTMDTRIDPHREAITMWLEHICSAKDWAAAVKRGKLSYSALLSTCLQNPNHWTIHLASSIINTPGCKEAKAIYKDRVAGAVADQAHLVRSVARTSFIESPDRLQSSERACGEVQPQENWELSRPMLRNSLEDSEIGGWHKWKGTWVSKPIGMI